jgi:hypothetical protein
MNFHAAVGTRIRALSEWGTGLYASPFNKELANETTLRRIHLAEQYL